MVIITNCLVAVTSFVCAREIKKAIRFLALENKLVSEGAGAISLAAAMLTPKEDRGRTVCVLSGGSIDSDKFGKIIVDT